MGQSKFFSFSFFTVFHENGLFAFHSLENLEMKRIKSPTTSENIWNERKKRKVNQNKQEEIRYFQNMCINKLK